MDDVPDAPPRGPVAQPCPADDAGDPAPPPSNDDVVAPAWLADVIRRQERKIDLLIGVARDQGAQLAALTAAIPAAAPPPPPKKAKRSPVKQASFREEHLMIVMASAPNVLTAVYLAVGLDTGLRRSELLALQWTDIDVAARSIEVRHGKGDKARTVYATQRAIGYMLMLPRIGPWVFSLPSGKTPTPKTMNVWVRQAIETSCVERAYGGRKVRIHAMRRGHATNATERGVDLRTVQAQLGHSSITITEGYIDSRKDHRERMRDRFEDGIGPSPSPEFLGLK